MNYTVGKGDCLWNIAKNQYGGQLKSAQDIQKAVDAIASHNNIKQANLIYVGNNLELPDFDSIFGTQGTSQLQEEEKQAKEVMSLAQTEENSSIFEELSKWEDLHAENMDISDSGEIIYAEELGLSFDFMEGKDVNDEKAYDEQTSKLAQGEMGVKDSNEDGLVSFNEYFAQETAPEMLRYKEMIASGEIDEQTVVDMMTDVLIQSNALFQIIDKVMGNSDDSLDEKEFQQYYQNLDAFTNGDGTTNRDGKINIEQISGYPEFLTGQLNLNNIEKDAAAKIVRTLLAA